jgi:hypothetical protein
MRSFLIGVVFGCVVLGGLVGCSSGGADDCASGSGLCNQACDAPNGRCSEGDGGTNSDGGAHGTDGALLLLSVSPGMLSPAFAPSVTLYQVMVGSEVSAVQVTATASSPGDSLDANGVALSSGVPSSPIPLTGMMTTILVTVRGRDETVQMYTVVVTRSQVSITYLKASNTEANDRFGTSISLSGDTLAVGAIFESSAATGINGNQNDHSDEASGAVYVFRLTGASWAQEAYIKASNTDAGDTFGWSVSVSGDTLAVGAINEASAATGVNGNQSDNSAPQAGAVYVFRRSGTVWAQEAYVKASNTDAGDAFGNSVSLSGDTLVVGAPFESSNATGINGDQSDNSADKSGAAYVFQRSGTTWTQQAYVKASNTDAQDCFGTAVALDGDTLAVGANGESSKATGINGDESDNSAMNSGATYVFQLAGSDWSQQAYVKASNTEAGDSFGWQLSLSGDTLAVSAVDESSNATGIDGDQANNSAAQSGAVYVFSRSGSAWMQQAYVKASNTEAGDGFGWSVSLSGDTLAVGALYESSNATGINGDQANNSAPGSGAVYLFYRSDATWMQESYVKASNTDAHDGFGLSCSVSGDLLAVGAPSEASNATGINGNQLDNSAPLSGAAYVYE